MMAAVLDVVDKNYHHHVGEDHCHHLDQTLYY
jgi:hypothetical protein